MNNWQVNINNEGHLLIKGVSEKQAQMNLFGIAKEEHGLCIYSYYLRSVRQLLSQLFPNSKLCSIDEIESIIKEEFCESRSVSIFKSILEKADIPYRTYSHVA